MAVRCLPFLVLIAIFSLPSVATAQHGDVSDSVRFEDELNPNEFMMTARMRAIKVPDFVLGIFFDEHASHWSDDQRNFSYGAEFVWRRGNDFELGVGLDYADLTMPSAFWKEEGDDPQSAEWTEIDLQLFSVVFSAYWFWDVTPWFTPFLGGGIGPGFVIGDITYYEPRGACESMLGGPDGFAPPECFTPDGDFDEDAFESPELEDSVPPVVPMINLTAGMRFTIADHAVIKLETGIYPYLFAGLGVGGQW